MPKKKSYEEVALYIKSKGCELLSNTYENSKTPLNVKCSECKKTYEVTYDHFKNTKKYKCNKCSGKHHYTIDDIKEIVSSESNCILVSKGYTNNNGDIELKCECGNIFSTTLKIFKKGKKQCDDCTNKILSDKFCKSHEDFVKDVYSVFKDEFSVVGEYKDMTRKVLMKHNVCGHEWDANPNDILYKKSGCPKCNESKGEKRISNFLKAYNVIFISQYKIKECKYKKALPFDFAIFDSNNNLKFLCEYDGILHYRNKFNNVKEFNLTKMRDKIKNDYCRQNNIKLIRIPYYQIDEIEEILRCALP